MIETLQTYGIDAYFTGCMSLCFDRSEEKRDNRVHMVDPYWIRRSRSRRIRSQAIWRLHNIGVDLSPWDLAPPGYYHYHHLRKDEEQNMNIDERLSRTRRLLDLYRKAGLVITSCLNCALSCRAFGTDVLFVHKEYKNEPRFSGLHDYLGGAKERRLRMENRTASERMTMMIDKKRQELIDMLGDLLTKSSTR